MKKLLLLLQLTIFCIAGNAQLIITDEPSATALAQQLVGPGVSISNVSFTGESLMAARFKNVGNLTSINLDSGIVLTTGLAKTDVTGFVPGTDGDGFNEAEWDLADTDWMLPGDLSLANLIGSNVDSMFDACILEFDFIPSGDSVKFNYVFSSEEYTEEYVCGYNDAFAFFISGPGISGQRNIALVPGTNIPVSIFNVNDVMFGLCPNNMQYFHDNIYNTYFTHDGHTVVLTASSAVQPCNTYHLKLVIADNMDGLLDSGVFLEGKSFTSNEPPSFQSVNAANACGGNQLTVNFSESILCSSIQSADFTVTGPGGPYTVNAWSSAACTGGAPGTTTINLTVNPSMNANGNYQVCLTNAAGSLTDLCGNIAPIACLSFNIGNTVPAFNPIGPVCSGATAPLLPSTSSNGISGTWSPATVNNTSSGTYTFTPATGQCATTATLTVTVTNAVIPSFNSIAPVCSGAAAPLLPATSLNGITGSWSPATVSNTISGTYTFTPAAGQCAATAILPVIVNPVSISNTTISICDNQLPYSWNGNSYFTAGSYAVTLTGNSGCDSVANLVLTVNPQLTSTTSVEICSSQLPYTWNGNSYPAAGTYSLTLTSTGGCDSVATLVLSVNSVVTSTTAVTVCNNQLPYQWNGNSYALAGTYSVTLTGAGTCDSIATLVLSAAAPPIGSSFVSICENDFPYSWNGNSYAVAGTYTMTITGTNGCDSIAVLNLAANAATVSLTSLTICSSQLPFSWNGNSYAAAGIYSISLTNSAGCDSVATLSLSTSNTLTSTTNINICQDALPYLWNGNSYVSGGNYTLTLTSSSGCDSLATLNLTVNNNTTSTTNITLCENELPYAWNGLNCSAAGTYTANLSNSNGCDSIATLVLTVNSTTTGMESISICESGLPYSWNNNLYTAAGIYSITLTNSNGCDSIVTLQLTVNPVTTSSTSITVCPNQLPYQWNGNSWSTAGSYAVTLTGSSGCDSTALLMLSVSTVPVSLTQSAVCSTALPYLWNGNSYSSAGTYPVTLSNSNGCDSIATLQLTVTDPSFSNTVVTICNNQLPYQWNGNLYSNSGNYIVTLTGTNGCDSTANLSLTVNQAATGNASATVCQSQLPYNWNGNAYTGPGSYSIVLTGSNGCDSVATLDLLVLNSTYGTQIVSVCNSQLPYNWNGVSYNNSGVYPTTLTNEAGCDSVVTLYLSVIPQATSSTAISICSTALPYSWNNNQYTGSGTYTATLAGSAGCDSIATLLLTVLPVPPLPPVQSPVVYCQLDHTAPLTASPLPGNQLAWYEAPVGGSVLPEAPLPSSLNPGVSHYYVSQFNGSCEGPRNIITVTVNVKPAFGDDKTVKLCTGQSASLNDLYNTAGTDFHWMLGNEITANTGAVNQEGVYTLTGENNAGCRDTATVTLVINPPVTANAGPDVTIETNTTYHLNGSGGMHYQWSPANLLSDPFTSDPAVVLNHDETFVLLVMDDIGCFDLDTVRLKVLDGPGFYVPTAFSPNGDGLNDYFRPTVSGIRSLEYFRVFNRYGELLFESTDASRGWDGTYRGKKQNAENYVWMVKGVDKHGKARTMNGNVVLIR